MAGLEDMAGTQAHRLAAEIANEPQWVVFGDRQDEASWAAHELEELVVVAAWWASSQA